jgi:hypothetical protein
MDVPEYSGRRQRAVGNVDDAGTVVDGDDAGAKQRVDRTGSETEQREQQEVLHGYRTGELVAMALRHPAVDELRGEIHEPSVFHTHDSRRRVVQVRGQSGGAAWTIQHRPHEHRHPARACQRGEN